MNKDCKEGHLFIINAVCMCVLCVPMSVCCVWVAFVVAVVRVLSCVLQHMYDFQRLTLGTMLSPSSLGSQHHTQVLSLCCSFFNSQVIFQAYQQGLQN